MTPRRVLVTGGTGFVGSHVIAALAERGVTTRALVRPSSDVRVAREYGVELHTGSLTDRESLRDAMSDVDAVIHLAALTHARTEQELQRVNADGTVAVAEAASEQIDRRAGQHQQPIRMVYLSSLAAAGARADRPVTPADVPRPLTGYGRSKLAGEAALKEIDGLEKVILRAPAVYGPRDRELLRFFRLARVGVLPIPGGPDRPLQLVHVADLARAIVMAATAEGPVSGLFHIADPVAYAWKDVCRMVAAAVGRKPVFVPIPQAALRAAAAVSETAAGAVGRSTMFSREKVRELLAPGWLCETDGALRAFGFAAAIPLDEGIRSTAEWYRIHGWL